MYTNSLGPEVICTCVDFLTIDVHTIQCHNCKHSSYNHKVALKSESSPENIQLGEVTNIDYNSQVNTMRLYCTGTD